LPNKNQRAGVPKLKKSGVLIIAILIIGVTALTVGLMTEKEVVSIHCGSGQYLDIDNNTCLLKSSIQPEVVIEEKIIEKTITVPMKVIRGISDDQNIFVVDNGENPTVFIQHCTGLTILNNPVMTAENDGSYTLRDSVAGVTIFVDKSSTYQYQITTVPYSGQSVNTVGTELMRSDVYKLKCEEETTTKQTTEDVFYFDIELTNNDDVLRIDGDIGKLVDNKRSITGMIVLYENGRIQNHMESFGIYLGSTGEFYETVDVDGTSNAGKKWENNETYRVIITYDGEQITQDFRK